MRTLISVLILLAAASTARATVIGHAEVDAVVSLPQSVMDSVGGQRWLFTHASVGANMLEGMQGLHGESAGRYQLVTEVAGDWSQVYAPPSPTVAGTIYDGARGNPGWAAKFSMFDDAVRNLGWRSPAIDVAMDKLCYIDPDADIDVYLPMMTALENDFPATRLVYTTMPIQSGSGADWSNALAMAYNEAVRQHCTGNGRLLLDIADIESHDSAGNPVTFVYGGQTCQRMYSGYTTDGGHLNALGSRRVALGWYAAAAVLASAGSLVPETPPAVMVGIVSITPNPARRGAAIHYRIERPGPVELLICDVQGRLVATLVRTVLPAGEYAAAWPGADASGRAQAGAVYFARLRSNETTSVRRLALVR
jgi:hypothetical protein